MTSPNRLSVDLEAMAASRSRMEGTIQNFTSDRTTVSSESATLRSHWTGVASNAFGAGITEWETHFAKVIEELGAMVEAMGGSGTVYGNQEDEALSTATGWSGGLPGL